MKRFISFVKDSKKLYIAFMALAVCTSFVSCKKLTKETVKTEVVEQVPKKEDIIDNTIIDNMKLISTMFPDKEFRREGRYFEADQFEVYYIDSIIPGSFVNKGNDELMVIVLRTRDGLSHAEGFYNAYMAVFDNSSSEMISETKHFNAPDSGTYQLFEGQGISYIFFSGYGMYHGYEYFDGALWQASPLWKMKWPKDAENDEFRNYWKDKSIEVYDSGIQMFTKKQNSSDELDYTWEKAEYLVWDDESESFELSN